MYVHRFTRLTALALGITGALALGNAHASGFQIRENSVKTMGRAFAGTATSLDDAAAVVNNPAAMSTFEQTTVRNDISLIDLTADYEGGGTTAVGTPLSGNDGGDPGDLTAVPAISAVLPVSGAFDNVTFGAAISAPFGLATEYDPNWIGRYNAVTSDVRVIDLTLAASVAITDRFSVGLGLILERADVTLSNAIDYGTAVCAGSGNPANCFNPGYPFRPQQNDGFLEVSGQDTSIGWLVGLHARPTDRLTIGLSHRGEVDHDLEGRADFTAPGSVTAVLGPAVADTAVYAPLTLPSITTVGVRYDFTDSFRMLLDYQRTGWSSLDAVRIFRPSGAALGNEIFDWKDTDLWALGAEYDLSPAFTLRGGVATDESPTNDTHRTPRLPDNDRLLYSLGLSWNVSDHMTIEAAYTRIEIDAPTINGVRASSGAVLTGGFDGYANLFGIAAQMKF
jgi:long-chain fatty acid transport protein